MQKKLLPKRFFESDIVNWQRAAKKQNRNLTNWMETILNNAVAAKKGKDGKKL